MRKDLDCAPETQRSVSSVGRGGTEDRVSVLRKRDDGHQRGP